MTELKTKSRKRKFEGLEQELNKRRRLEVTPTQEPSPEQITQAYNREDTPTPRFYSTERPVMSSTLVSGKSEDLKKLDGHLFLPVSRYSNLFHSNTDLKGNEVERKFTGKFYFYEPDSPFVLDLGKTRVFGSKYHAITTLNPDSKQWAEEGILKITGWDYVQDLLEKRSTGKMPEKMYGARLGGLKISDKEMKFLNQIFNQYYTTIVTNRNSIPKIPLIDTTPFFPTDDSKIWSSYRNFKTGNHDFMDVAIYKAAKKRGLDTVILQHEVGEHRAVTEIVDTRENSQNHLYRLPPTLTPSVKYPFDDPKNHWDAQDWIDYQTQIDKLTDEEYSDYFDREEGPQIRPDKYATIWFSDDGFLRLVNGKFEWSEQ